MPDLGARHTLLDPIHGSIRLTDDELRILNHPLFRRLHQIRQNGLLYLVFPATSHSRFEHSVGVLQVASDIVDALRINSYIASRKAPPAISLADSREAGKATELRSEEYDELRRIVRIAALVHDLGHGPYSHHFDSFAPGVDDIRALIGADLHEAEYLLAALPSDGERVKHELISCILFAKISRDLELDQKDAQAVASILLKAPSLAGGTSSAPLRLASDIVASAPADADRMDYLLRDSKSIGVNYGLYDTNRLLKSFLVYVESGNNDLRLGVKRSGLRAVENFIQARFELFVQVYYHKTNRAVTCMLKRIADMVEERSLSPFEWSSLDSLVETYLTLSDDYFLRILRGEIRDAAIHDEDVQELAKAIHARRLWKRMYDGPHAEPVLTAIEDEYSDAGAFIDRIQAEATKDLDDGAAILVRHSGGVYQQSGTSWMAESPIIRALHKDESELERVYVKISDATRLKACRTTAWRAARGME